MKENIHQLHCGACKKRFKTAGALMKHLDKCIYAKAGTLLLNDVFKALTPQKKRRK